MNKIKSFSFKPMSALSVQLLLIVVLCLSGAVLQGNGFLSMTHYHQVFFLTILFLIYFAMLYSFRLKGLLSHEDTAVTMMILLGVLLRLSYVLLSGLYDRQHDAGAFTGMGTDFINPGHIGYVEYIYKFHKLPDINPYTLFGYYHPCIIFCPVSGCS